MDMNKIKKIISIFMLSICAMLYRNTEIEIIEDNDFIKIIKIKFWGK